MSLTGAAKLAGIVGWPVAHSRSPVLHGYWLQRYGIDGAYVPMAVKPENLRRALQTLPLLGFAGCNITIPHKEEALHLVDSHEPSAKRAGGVNTVVVDPRGNLIGSSTDGYGFIAALRAAAPRFDAAAAPAVVLGAGGAARAVVAALLDHGAWDIRLVNRTPERAAKLAKELGGDVRGIAWDKRSDALAGAGLLVNATSLGMEGQPALDLPLDALPRDAIVNDIVYVPLETPLLAAARAHGNLCIDGLGMLLHQAAPGFEAWFGLKPEVDDGLRQAVLATLQRAR
jgi:shikimate dehydrogenase